MSRRARHREGGFALIETIAVLALSALVLASLLIASDIVTRNAGAATRRAHDVETLATGLAALRKDVAAMRVARLGGGPEAPLLFEGERRALGLAVEDASDAGSGQTLVWIEARYETNRNVILRFSGELLGLTSGFDRSAFADPVVLISGPWTYRFSYAGPGGGGRRWADAWTDPLTLPSAIRLEVLDPSGSRPVLPPLVMPVRVDAQAGCAATGACGGDGSEEVDPAAPEEESDGG